MPICTPWGLPLADYSRNATCAGFAQRFTIRFSGISLFKTVAEQFDVLLKVRGDFRG